MAHPSIGPWRTISALLACAVMFGCGDSSSSRSSMASVNGTVTGGVEVEAASVLFIDAELAGRSTSVQPLEDLVGSETASAMTDAQGLFSLSLPTGSYYVYVLPPAGDTVHLPGGDLSRRSISFEKGSVSDLEIRLSERPPAGATYIGSSVCLVCHPGVATIFGTLHFVGLRRLTAAGPVLSALQDLSGFPGADAALSFFPDGNPDDNTGGGDAYGFRVSGADDFNVLLGLDATGYFQAIESLDGLSVSARLYIEFTYGGEGLFKQLFVTRLDAQGAYTALPVDGTYHVLPAQYSETRGDAADGEVTVPGWVPYEPDCWAAPLMDGGNPSEVPVATESFDNRCAGCHFTGMSLTRNPDGLFQAHAVADPDGVFDYDGDGRLDEMNIGCERCHGPGSEHFRNPGTLIVQPAYLPPGRANLVCGQCHAAGRGNGVIDGEGEGGYPSRNDPVSGAIEFFEPGMSPAEFFGRANGEGILPDFGTSGGFFDTVNLASDLDASWGDRAFASRFDHSKNNRQHYLDHLRSKHAVNAFEMVTCAGCHSPHRRDVAGQIRSRVDNNVLCFECHVGQGDFADLTADQVDEASADNYPLEVREAINDHVVQRTFEQIGVAMNLGPAPYGSPASDEGLGRCVICHMTRTARSASWVVDIDGFTVRGDISSHTFDAISPDVGESMELSGAAAVLNSCEPCHRGIPLGSWPDYRYTREE